MQARFTLYLLALCIAAGYTTIAQDASRIYVEPDGWSIGTNFGMTDLWGNVGTQSPVTHYTNSKYFNKVAFMGGMFGRYNIHPCLAIRLQFSYGTLYATDQWNYDAVKGSGSPTEGSDAYQRYARAQDALDDVFEGTALFELLPRRFNPESRAASRKGQPFIGLGFSYFHFVPYSSVGASDTWVKTYNLDLEGQGWGTTYPKQYSLWQPAIPMAIGYRWDIGQHVNLGVEYMFRYTFTKYLDGVSGKYVGAQAYSEHLSAANANLAELVVDKGYYEGYVSAPNAAGTLRGNPGYTDKYSTFGITLSYKVHARTRKWW